MNAYCPKCNSPMRLNGYSNQGKQKYRCKGCNYSTVAPKKTQGVTAMEIKAGMLSEQDLRDKYDWGYKIKKAVESIPEGQFYEEPAFREMSGVPIAHFRRFADSGEWDDYKGRAQHKIYWGHPTAIKRMKDDGILQ